MLASTRGLQTLCNESLLDPFLRVVLSDHPCPRVGTDSLPSAHVLRPSRIAPGVLGDSKLKVTAERIPESKVLLRIEIPPEQVEKAIERTYRDASRRLRIPGFRPGKAPRNIVERYVGGRETIQHEGIDRLIDESYRQAVAETAIRPVGEPDVLERPEFKAGEPLVIEASVPIAPTVELGDYQTIRMPMVSAETTPEQVNTFIDVLRERNAEWTTVERAIQDGDQAVIDVVGVVGTVPTLYGPSGDTILQTSGGEEVFNVKDHAHVVDVEGESEFAPGFDEELVGLNAGGEKRFGLTLPADYADQAHANQSVVFTVHVHEVKEKHLPDLNDEFAKKVEGGETMEALREGARTMLQSRLESEIRQAYESTLISAVLERSTIELPDVMVQRQIDSEIEEMKADLVRQRIGWDEYLRSRQRSEESIRADLHEPGARALRTYLVLREIANREGLAVAPSEIDQNIETTAVQFGRAANIVRERLNTREERENIESRILQRKVLERLAEIAQSPTPEGAATEEAAAASSEGVTSEPASETTASATESGPTAATEGEAGEATPSSGTAALTGTAEAASAPSMQSESSAEASATPRATTDQTPGEAPASGSETSSEAPTTEEAPGHG